MPLVVNTLDPVPTARRVTAALIAPIGFYLDENGDPREVVTTWTATVGDDGAWSLDLPPSEQYDAELTWYRIDEPGATHAVVVPAQVGPHQLRDLLIDDPQTTCCAPQASPTTLLGLRDVDASGLATGRVLGVLATTPATFGFVPSGGGGSGGPLAYEHTQVEPSTVWLILHDLPFTPAGIEVRDHTGAAHHPAVSWPAIGQVRADFDTAVRGVARLS